MSEPVARRASGADPLRTLVSADPAHGARGTDPARSVPVSADLRGADAPLAESDPEVARLIAEENRLEHDKIRLIASENYASRAVMEATGSILTNKYSEGYAHKRYYEGQQAVDQVEELAIEDRKSVV